MTSAQNVTDFQTEKQILNTLIASDDSLRKNYSGKKVLITGGAGFVGSNLAYYLNALGAQVTVVDSYHPEYGANDANFHGFRDQIRIVKGDVRDPKLLDSVLEDIEMIFHSAAQCSHVDSMIEPFEDLSLNNEGTLRILEALRAIKNVQKRIIPYCYVSTRAVIGASLESPALETTLPNPTDVYGVNKLACEYYGAVYARCFGLPVTSLRLTNCFGPRHQMRHGKYGILNWFISQAMRGNDITIYGTGSQLRDYLFIYDACEALARAGLFTLDRANELREPSTAKGIKRAQPLSSDTPYYCFNLASGNPKPFVDCARMITEMIAGAKLTLIPWPADRKAIETGDFVADCEAATQLLNWAPKVNFRDGLKATVDFYRSHSQYYL